MCKNPSQQAPEAPFPDGWDPARDLAVLVGRGAKNRAHELTTGGQVNLIVYLPRDSGAEGLGPTTRVTRDAAELTAAIVGLPDRLPRHVVVRPTEDPWADEEVQKGVARTIAMALRSKRLQLRTVELHGATWIQNALQNMKALVSVASIDCLRGAFADQPAVIVSPGPSLSKNLHQLPAIKGRALILSGTHGLASLRRVDTRADFVLAADAGDLQRHYEPSDVAGCEAMIVAATCRPACFATRAPRAFSFAGNGPVDNWVFDALGEEAQLSSGGSVACSALSLAVHLGCDPIVFVGQDLSFPGGRFYAAGSVDGDATVELVGDAGFFLRKPAGSDSPGATLPGGDIRFTRDQRLFDVPAYDGGTVRTSESFQAFLGWFGAAADGLRGRVRLLNCTEGGARIENMEQLPLAEASAAWDELPTPIGDVLDTRARGVVSEARALGVRTRIGAMLRALDPCQQLAVRCNALAQAAARDPRRLAELEQTEASLTRALAPVRFLSLIGQGPIMRAQEAARQATALEASLAASRTLFAVVEAACRALRNPLARALSELEATGQT